MKLLDLKTYLQNLALRLDVDKATLAIEKDGDNLTLAILSNGNFRTFDINEDTELLDLLNDDNLINEVKLWKESDEYVACECEPNCDCKVNDEIEPPAFKVQQTI